MYFLKIILDEIIEKIKNFQILIIQFYKFINFLLMEYLKLINMLKTVSL